MDGHGGSAPPHPLNAFKSRANRGRLKAGFDSKKPLVFHPILIAKKARICDLKTVGGEDPPARRQTRKKRKSNMKNLTRLQARNILRSAGIATKIVFGSQLSGCHNGCSISVGTTTGRGQNMRITAARVYPNKLRGGSANAAVATARELVKLLNVPVTWESNSIQTVLQTIHPNGTKELISCVSPYRSRIAPLP